MFIEYLPGTNLPGTNRSCGNFFTDRLFPPIALISISEDTPTEPIPMEPDSTPTEPTLLKMESSETGDDEQPEPDSTFNIN